MKLTPVLKTTALTCASLCLPFLTSFLDSPLSGSGTPHRPNGIRTVVIDPGHGGKDAGCIGRHHKEKDIALAISLHLGALIRERYPDVKVVYTRDKDIFVPLHERARIANKAEADLFISIHCNHAGRRNHAHGTETYVMGLHRAEENLQVAKRENSAILLEDDYIEHYDGYDPESPEGHIILSMYQNAYLEHSILLAHHIEEQFSVKLKRRSRGVKQAGFLVLRNTTMPSVLVETGFLSNDEEEAFLGNPQNQRELAKAILNAFSDYRQIVEKPMEPDMYIADGLAMFEPGEAPNGIRFYVQLLATGRPLTTEIAQWKLQAPVETIVENGLYKYLAGPFADADNASAVQHKARNGCCKDAFVVAYRGQERITVQEAIAALR